MSSHPGFSTVRVIWFSVWRFAYNCLSFFLWPLCCLFFYLRLLVTPLVSSNFFLLKQDLIPFGKETYNRHGTTIWNDLLFEQYDERGCLPFLFNVFRAFSCPLFTVFRQGTRIKIIFRSSWNSVLFYVLSCSFPLFTTLNETQSYCNYLCGALSVVLCVSVWCW